MHIKILGAGSIGNHLAHACRLQGWTVTLCDLDAAALARTRNTIYPTRYGTWDDTIRLSDPAAVAAEVFDAVIIGTPPDTHIKLALEQLRTAPPRVLLIEKPLATPDLAGIDQLRSAAAAAGTRVLVAYNHRLTRHTRIAQQWLLEEDVGQITTLRVLFREHWGGIFAAHPWLAGPADSYLGFTERGGGALGEHSHGINLWQHFATLVGHGRISDVMAMLDEVEQDGARFDRIAQLSVRTTSGLVGTIEQDVITQPAQKWLRLETSCGYLEWQANAAPGIDSVRWHHEQAGLREERVEKTRPDDFHGEIEHLGQLIADPALPSVLDLECGVDTLRVIAAAIASARSGQRVVVNYDAPTPVITC